MIIDNAIAWPQGPDRPTLDARLAVVEARTRRIEIILYVAIALGVFGRWADRLLSPFLGN